MSKRGPGRPPLRGAVTVSVVLQEKHLGYLRKLAREDDRSLSYVMRKLIERSMK